MQKYVSVRLAQGLVALLVLTMVVFALARMTGSPIDVMLGISATEAERAVLARELGLDKPLPVQYLIYLQNILRGDFGASLITHKPALDYVLERFPATLTLGAAAILVSVLIGVPIGVLSAVRRDTALDTFGKVIATLGQSVPVFWLGLVLMLIFGVNLRVLPTSGIGGPTHYVLPALTMGWYTAAGIMRLIRSSMLDVIGSDYITLARTEGIPERLVVWKLALKNALGPVLTYAGLLFVSMLAGSVITETVFSWPGVGRLAVESITYRDFPTVQVIVLLFGAMYIVANLIVDILYGYLNPRVRY